MVNELFKQNWDVMAFLFHPESGFTVYIDGYHVNFYARFNGYDVELLDNKGEQHEFAFVTKWQPTVWVKASDVHEFLEKVKVQLEKKAG